ncbi:MAG: hypothetical protein J6B37_09460 [Clostridia bacterium]|nr:hypothetical protein [Clostridia bacterium]
MKKLLAFFTVFIIIFFNGCSKEEKFGLEQFVDRINKNYNMEYSTSDFLLGKNQREENCLFYEQGNSMIVLILNSENLITGTGLLITDDNDIQEYINQFCRISSIITNSDYTKQSEIFEQCGINVNNIKKTDSNWIITVGKYKYSVVCNNYSITLFCERV